MKVLSIFANTGLNSLDPSSGQTFSNVSNNYHKYIHLKDTCRNW